MNTAAAMHQEPDTARQLSATGAATGASHSPAAAPAAGTEGSGTNQPPTTCMNRRDAIRACDERGDSVADIARAFGISSQYVFKVRKAANWQHCAPEMREKSCTLHDTSDGNGRHLDGENRPPTLPTNQDPTSAAVAQTAAGLIVRGLPTIAPPRDLRQLAAALDVYRKAAGLDKTHGGNSPRVLINLNAGIRVRERAAAQVVDVDAADEKRRFRVGTSPFPADQ